MKKNMRILLTAAMACTIGSSVAFGQGGGKSSADFDDLGHLNEAAKAKYDAMIAAGIFDGVGERTFGPSEKMNRAQFAKAAALVFGLKPDMSLTTSRFADVRADDPANGYALPYIEALRSAGLTDGAGPNAYNPAGEVTKEQLAAFLIRGLHREADAQAAQGVSDSTVSDWAAGYAALALQLNLMENKADGTFGGKDAATRDLLVTSSYEAKRQITAQDSGGQGTLLAQPSPTYAITNAAQAQIKSVLQEKTAEGWRLAAVVKLHNASDEAIRIPDYELRLKTADGTTYTLQASAANVTSIPARGNAELSYMAEPDTKQDIQAARLQWVHVNEKVYPKQETVLADAPVDGLVWNGQDAVIRDSAYLGQWGDSFAIPGVTSNLTYSAAKLSKQYTGQSPTYVVQLQVENRGSYAETVPDFTLSGKAEGRTYIGQKIGQEPVTVNPGEQKYVSYSVTAEPGVELDAFYVLTPESFLKPGQTTTLRYYTGRIGFALPAGGSTSNTAPAYQMGTPIDVDRLSQAINPQLQVALQELEWFENDGQSYKTGVAKLKFTNRGTNPIAVPLLGAELVAPGGAAYNGTQQAGAASSVSPGMGVVSVVTFTVPLSETSDRYTLRLLDQPNPSSPQSAQPPTQVAQAPIAEVSATVEAEDSIGNTFSFYPYTMKLSSYSLTNSAAKNAMTGIYVYSYKLEMGVDLQTTDEVAVDPTTPKLLLQLEGDDGKRLGSKTYSLAGDNRIMNGVQTVIFDSVDDEFHSNVSVKVYELVSTPYGDARRLLADLKRQ